MGCAQHTRGTDTEGARCTQQTHPTIDTRCIHASHTTRDARYTQQETPDISAPGVHIFWGIGELWNSSASRVMWISSADTEGELIRINEWIKTARSAVSKNCAKRSFFSESPYKRGIWSQPRHFENVTLVARRREHFRVLWPIFG